MRAFGLHLALFRVVSPAASLFDLDGIFYPGTKIMRETAACSGQPASTLYFLTYRLRALAVPKPRNWPGFRSAPAPAASKYAAKTNCKSTTCRDARCHASRTKHDNAGRSHAKVTQSIRCAAGDATCYTEVYSHPSA